MTADVDVLAAAREAFDRHDWQSCYDAVYAVQLDDPRAEADRLELLADAAWWLGQVEKGIAAREAAHRIFESIGAQRAAGRCAIWLYQDHCMRARPAVASGWLQRARRALDGDTECVEYGALLLREAEAAHGGGRLEEAVELAERARALARTLASEDLEAEALQTLGRVLIDDGNPIAGLAHLDEAMLFAVEGRLGPYSTGKIYCSLISACEELGDLERAAEWTEATTTWAARHPFAIFPGICRVHRAVVFERRGDLEEAEREAMQACGELADSHLPNAVTALATVGDIRRRLGQLDLAEAAFGQAESLSGQPCGGAALLRLAQGRVEEARRVIQDCLAHEPPLRPGRARLLPAAVQIAVAAGDLDDAEAAVVELESIAERFDRPMLHALAEVARGRLELAMGDPGGSTAALQAALHRWHELQVPYEIATASTLLAQAQREAGHEAAARESFARARSLFEQIGAGLDARDVDSVRRPHRPAGLTEREIEVLSLIAAGRTNREIADQLHLSPKTVSRHLTNIFTKIQVSSRAAATAFAFEQRLVGRGR
ncbi:MAG TPA: LuxR C-terminal-related transcriptional regulator [Mycobacteriales bacterium]|nr:LuxR C-terminal-related transcriptional regulator [Mycobacteriales bacterium]